MDPHISRSLTAAPDRENGRAARNKSSEAASSESESYLLDKVVIRGEKKKKREEKLKRKQEREKRRQEKEKRRVQKSGEETKDKSKKGKAWKK